MSYILKYKLAEQQHAYVIGTAEKRQQMESDTRLRWQQDFFPVLLYQNESEKISKHIHNTVYNIHVTH